MNRQPNTADTENLVNSVDILRKAAAARGLELTYTELPPGAYGDELRAGGERCDLALLGRIDDYRALLS